jgi:hypothetical protein
VWYDYDHYDHYDLDYYDHNRGADAVRWRL